ncbi:hypothetical protein [Halosimplex amylolyticum]|uniref:hypothetical protein n=1 Tax=Halosimplex amylolyticum TaxID=3396616 RepID=UPI003F55C912
MLTGLSDAGRTQLRTYYRQIRGTEAESGTGLEPLTDGGRAEFQEALEDPAISGQTLAQFRRQTDDETWRELLDRDVCNSPCESTIRSVYQYTKDSDGLDPDEAKKLLNAYGKADEVSLGPGSSSSSAVQEQIDELAENDVEGVTDAMADVSASKSGFKQIAGEVDAAKQIFSEDNEIGSADIEMQNVVRDIQNAPNSKTEIDIDVDGDITVNGKKLESPSIESKNYNPEEYSGFLVKKESRDLIDKFVTQSRSRVGKDSFVVVTTDEYLDKLKDLGQTNQIRNTVQRRTSSDIEIEFTTYGELGD